MNGKFFVALIIPYLLLGGLYMWTFEIGMTGMSENLTKKLSQLQQQITDKQNFHLNNFNNELQKTATQIKDEVVPSISKIEKHNEETQIKIDQTNKKISETYEILHEEIRDFDTDEIIHSIKKLIGKENEGYRQSSVPNIKQTFNSFNPFIKKKQDRIPTTTISEPIFDIEKYKGHSPEYVLRKYIDFHNDMTSGKIPPRFLLVVEINDRASGLGNQVEVFAFGFLVAVLTGRAFLADFVSSYAVTNVYFDPPGFDWTYHTHPSPAHAQEFISPKVLSAYPNSSDWLTEYNSSFVVINPLLMSEKGHRVAQSKRFQETIPYTLRNWKMELVRLMFSRPKPILLNEIEALKDKMRMHNYEKFISIQLRIRMEGIPRDLSAFMACAEYWLKFCPKCALFIATDSEEGKKFGKKKFGDRFFYFDIVPAGPGGEFGIAFLEEHQKGVFMDWYMLGEAVQMISTAASSYGISAADRGGMVTYPQRFHMGGLTQCTNPNDAYYFEHIYFSPMDTFNKTGKMEWLNFIH